MIVEIVFADNRTEHIEVRDGDDPSQLAAMIHHMERCVWEASSLIRARMDVQEALDECVDAFCKPVPLVRVPSQSLLAAAEAAAAEGSSSSSAADIGAHAPPAPAVRAKASPARKRR